MVFNCSTQCDSEMAMRTDRTDDCDVGSGEKCKTEGNTWASISYDGPIAVNMDIAYMVFNPTAPLSETIGARKKGDDQIELLRASIRSAWMTGVIKNRVTRWAQPALKGTHGGRRPTLWRPKADAGGSGGEAPRKKISFFLQGSAPPSCPLPVFCKI